ncbi:hypothetical protein WA158_007127 [Blastocystis sp. Blastoise]
MDTYTQNNMDSIPSPNPEFNEVSIKEETVNSEITSNVPDEQEVNQELSTNFTPSVTDSLSEFVKSENETNTPISETSQPVEPKVEPTPVATPTTPPTPAVTPVLKGEYRIENSSYIWIGKWGMGSNLEFNGITSDFQLSLHKAPSSPIDTDSPDQPQSGLYNGFFWMKTTPVKKIQENRVNIEFEQKEDRFRVTGSGTNKFGVFHLEGYYDPITREMCCAKVYAPKPNANAKLTKSKSVPAARPRSRAPTYIQPSLPTPQIRPAHRAATASFLRETIDVPENLSEDLKYCYKILERLMNHKWAYPFNIPVNPVELNIPDYFTIIHSPMDFGTIKDKLIKLQYETATQFADDVRLVFNNAFTYNRPDSDVFIMAKALSEIFERDYDQFTRRIYEQFPDVPSPDTPKKRKFPRTNSVPSIPHTRSIAPPPKRTRLAYDTDILSESTRSLLDSVSKVEETVKKDESYTKITSILTKLQQEMNDIKNRLEENKGTEIEEIPFTMDDKQELRSRIDKLPYEKQLKVFEIIQEHTKIDGESTDVIEVDLDTLDNATLRSLKQFIDSNTDNGVGGNIYRNRSRHRAGLGGNGEIMNSLDYESSDEDTDNYSEPSENKPTADFF